MTNFNLSEEDVKCIAEAREMANQVILRNSILDLKRNRDVPAMSYSESTVYLSALIGQERFRECKARNPSRDR